MEKNLAAAFVVLFGLLLIYTVGQEITIVKDAGEAVTIGLGGIGKLELRGSPGAYFYDRGSGEGSNNLIVYLEGGGGWCESEQECVNRNWQS